MTEPNLRESILLKLAGSAVLLLLAAVCEAFVSVSVEQCPTEASADKVHMSKTGMF